jgi:hypothetical protein
MTSESWQNALKHQHVSSKIIFKIVWRNSSKENGSAELTLNNVEARKWGPGSFMQFIASNLLPMSIQGHLTTCRRNRSIQVDTEIVNPEIVQARVHLILEPCKWLNDEQVRGSIKTVPPEMVQYRDCKYNIAINGWTRDVGSTGRKGCTGEALMDGFRKCITICNMLLI